MRSTQDVNSTGYEPHCAKPLAQGRNNNWIGPTKWRAWREQAGKDKEQEANKDERYKEKQKEKKRKSDRRRNKRNLGRKQEQST